MTFAFADRYQTRVVAFAAKVADGRAEGQVVEDEGARGEGADDALAKPALACELAQHVRVVTFEDGQAAEGYARALGVPLAECGADRAREWRAGCFFEQAEDFVEVCAASSCAVQRR